MTDQTEQFVREWAEARQARLAVYRQRVAFQCELAEKGDPEDGDGVPPCYRHAAADEFCPTCLKREPVYQQEYRLRFQERASFRRLRAHIDRLKLAPAAPEGR